MRKLLFLAAILVSGALAQVPVQTKVCSSASAIGSLGCTFVTTPTTNNLIVGFVRTSGCIGTQTAFTWSDNKGNTWQQDKYSQLTNSVGRGASMGSAVASSSSGTFTVSALTNTSGTTCSFWTMIIQEYSGMATSSWVDGTPHSNSSGASTGTGGNCGATAASASNTVIVTGIGISPTVNEAGYNINSGFTVDGQDLAGAANHSGAMGHILTSSISSFTPGWSWSSNNVSWVALCTVYKQSTFGAGSAGVKRRFLGMGQ